MDSIHNTAYDTAYDVAVVGNGLIGSAAAKYLAAAGAKVLAVGPAEPDNWKTHKGVFASHYDQGRITRIIDPDWVWAELGARSIAAYPEIERASGVTFHHPVGCLRVSPYYLRSGDTLAQAADNGKHSGTAFSTLNTGEITAHFPFFKLPPGSTALWERGGAGYVNPRQLVAAQLSIASAHGANVVRETVVAISRGDGVVTLMTDHGSTYRAGKVLVSAGAFTNPILVRKLDIRTRAVAIVLARVDAEEAARLQAMPSIIYRLAEHPRLFSIYALPPVPYPDGHTYVKIGGTLFQPNVRATQQELIDWFHTDGRSAETDAVREVLLDMLPGLRADRFETRPCTTAYTAHEHPYIGALDDGPGGPCLYVAAGGSGSAAKSSNEIGRIAALLVQHGSWNSDLAEKHFAPVFQ